MFGKRKRIPYDPPGSRKRNGKRRPPKRSDQIFLSRRMLFLKGTVSAAFLALAGRLGYMQIVEGENYDELATKNVQRSEQPKAPRGMIFDRVGRVLAENYRAWEVKIVPAELPKDAIELKRVKDTLITALRLPETLTINPFAVPKGSELTICRRVAELLKSSDPDNLIEYIQGEWNRNYLVLVREPLTADQAATFRAAAMELPGVEVMNSIDYLIDNSGDPRLPIIVKSDVSKEIARKLEANSLYLPGVLLDDSALRRRYRGGEVMSHLLGYVGTISENELEDPDHFTEGGIPIYLRDDIIGKDGIERTMESHLRGKRGYQRVEVDGHGVPIRIIPGTEIPPVPGKNIKLSIDLELQALASQALQDGLRYSREHRQPPPGIEYNANSGAVIVLDPRNGEVLAMVSYPHYDNSLFLDGISQRKYDEYLDKSKNEPLLNRAASTSFPPGSTLKVFVGASALRAKVIDDKTTFTCTGAIDVPWTWNEAEGTQYKCWVYAPPINSQHGTLDIYGALEQSCDIFFYNAGTPEQKPLDAVENLHYFDLHPGGQRGEKHYFRGLGIDKIHHALKEVFWFGEPTGIDLPSEAPGLVPNEAWLFDNYGEGWSSGDTINVSIGQGFFLASPLQLAVNTAAVANGGKVYRPLLVREFVDDSKERIEKVKPHLKREMKIEEKYLDVVREGMRRVVHGENGTARLTRDGTNAHKWPLTNPEGQEQITIAGKTGTAEFGEQADDLTYAHQHAWFTCYAPYEDPEVVVTVFLYDGGGGDTYAVPVADRVLRAYFEIKKKRERGVVLRKDKRPIDVDHPAPEPPAAAQQTPTAQAAD